MPATFNPSGLAVRIESHNHSAELIWNSCVRFCRRQATGYSHDANSSPRSHLPPSARASAANDVIFCNRIHLTRAIRIRAICLVSPRLRDFLLISPRNGAISQRIPATWECTSLLCTGPHQHFSRNQPSKHPSAPSGREKPPTLAGPTTAFQFPLSAALMF